MKGVWKPVELPLGAPSAQVPDASPVPAVSGVGDQLQEPRREMAGARISLAVWPACPEPQPPPLPRAGRRTPSSEGCEDESGVNTSEATRPAPGARRARGTAVLPAAQHTVAVSLGPAAAPAGVC